MLMHCISRERSTQAAVVHCNAQTSGEHIVHKLAQSCVQVSANTGRVYKPKDCERLILYMKDINLPRPDKYGTSQLLAFVQQLLTYGGYYDAALEWVGLENIQIVASMTPANTAGRHAVSTRLTSIMRIANVGYPSERELVSIVGAYLPPVLNHCVTENAVSGDSAARAAATMVKVYEDVRAQFKPDEHAHYTFTPRYLTRWVLGLLRCDRKFHLAE
jgi:dynein heavy chain 2